MLKFNVQIKYTGNIIDVDTNKDTRRVTKHPKTILVSFSIPFNSSMTKNYLLNRVVCCIIM